MDGNIKRVNLIHKYRIRDILIRFIKTGIWKTRKIVSFEGELFMPELVYSEGSATFNATIKPVGKVSIDEQ